jgi:hypothetical protein
MNKAIFKKTVSIFLSSVLFLGLIYVLFSPTLISLSKRDVFSFSVPKANAITKSVTLAVGNEATVTSPGPIALLGTINGVSGGAANQAVYLSVLSSSLTGFTMSVSGGQTNALHGTNGYDFYDYAPVSAGTPDWTWVAPQAGSSAFGYTVLADTTTYANQKFRFGGTACNSGSFNSLSLCWYGMSTTPLTVVTNTGGFKSGLSTETLGFEAQYTAKSNYAIPTGTYTATITVTVSPI